MVKDTTDGEQEQKLAEGGRQRMVKDTMDGYGYNGWLRIQRVVKDTMGGLGNN